MEEPLVIYIDAADYSVLVYCAECAFREVLLHATEARLAGRKHQQAVHKYRKINTVIIHGE